MFGPTPGHLEFQLWWCGATMYTDHVNILRVSSTLSCPCSVSKQCILIVSVTAEIIPRFFTLLSEQQPLTIQGTGLNVRRYLYGADAADGFDTLLHKGEVGEAYNIGSSFAVTNLEVAVRMLELFGYSPQKDFHHHLAWIANRPFNDSDYRVNGSKLEALGWRQHVPFAEGLRATVEWYGKYMHAWWPNVTKTISVSSTARIQGERQPFVTHSKRNSVVNGSFTNHRRNSIVTDEALHMHNHVAKIKIKGASDEAMSTEISGSSSPVMVD